MGETDIVGRLWGWCRDPKIRLQTRLKRLGFSVKPTHLEEVVLPLLFDIGTITTVAMWVLTFPISLFLRYPARIQFYPDLLAILWFGSLLQLNSLTIYTYKHHPSLPRRFANATKLVLFTTDMLAVVGFAGWVFQLPKELIILAGICLTVWDFVLRLRFPIDEKNRPQFYKQLFDKSILVKTGRRIKAALGEPHYH